MLETRDGVMLLEEPICDGLDLGDRDLRRANFSNVIVSGLELSGCDLREADFSSSELYWIDLYSADCSDASFFMAILQGANFKAACLRRVDFSGATISADQLGKESSFAHADLSDALLEGAKLSGTRYDSKTIWPLGFNPSEHGLVLTEDQEEWLVDPVCRK